MAARHPKTSAKPSQAAEPQRPEFVPPWASSRSSVVSHNLQSPETWIAFLRAGRLRLPRFQRGWKWTDGQIARLFDSLIGGYYTGSLLLWERYDLPSSRELFGEVSVDCAAGPGQLVVDGQQRLAALATAAMSGRFFLDVLGGRLVFGGGPWCLPAGWLLREDEMPDIIGHIREHAQTYGLDLHEVRGAVGTMIATLQRAYVGAVRFGPDWSMERVIESYKRLNSEGTPMDPAELAEGLRRAEGANSAGRGSVQRR